MNNNPFEGVDAMQNSKKEATPDGSEPSPRSLSEAGRPENSEQENSYQRYRELGGIINEQDYQSALDRAKNITISNNKLKISQVNAMARTSGITLHNSEDASDQRIILYEILRTDFKSKEEAEYHHTDMSNQKLFAEVLRILGDVASLNKLIDAHHKVGIYCPICMKVVASGEECR